MPEIGMMIPLGLAAGLHCILMCGPLAMALPIGSQPIKKQIWLRVLFISGRILVYGLMGFLVGLLGSPISWLGFQHFITVAIVLAVVALVAFWDQDFWKPIRQKLQGISRQQLQKQPATAIFILGMANGLIPCGVVYAALGVSAVSGSAWTGAGCMFAFGIANSWWHLFLMFGWRFPTINLPGWRFLLSPKASLAFVAIVLTLRLVISPENQTIFPDPTEQNPPTELHFCGK